MKNVIKLLTCLMLCSTICAQEKSKDTITRVSSIVYVVNGNQVSFNPENPPLHQIAGAPKAFYTYFWEFGDGNYSLKEKPIHSYKEKGNYYVQLSVTNNYDDGKPPSTRPIEVAISSENNDVSKNEKHNLISAYNGFRLQTNRDPVPEEEMQFVLSYGNDKPYPTSGKIYVFFNERKYKEKNFELVDTRTYHNEFESDDVEIVSKGSIYESQFEYLAFTEESDSQKLSGYVDTTIEDISTQEEVYNDKDKILNEPTGFVVSNESESMNGESFVEEYFNDYSDEVAPISIDEIALKIVELDTTKLNLPLSLEEAKEYYQDFKIYDFNDMEPQQERNMFMTFKTTPEMLKDTSAVISIRSIYVPERGVNEHKELTKEMEIVTSHDPNKMAVYDTRLNYRLVRFKKLKYKVRFQNDGEGPARLIKLNVDVPEMLDKSSLEIIDMYPKCKICPEEEVNYSCLDTIFSKDQISFQFKNIYLPGTAQKGVHDKDSTKGFVKYAMKFGKDFHKKKSKSKTAIIFDKNEPIITNTSTSRFLPGISIGAKSGFNSFPDLKDSKSYFVGATISPYKSYKKYFQAEIMIGTHEFGDFQSISEPVDLIDLPDGTRVDSAIRMDEISQEFTKLNIDIVPISFRYNLNGIVGIGVGPQLSFDISNKVENNGTSNYFTYFNNQIGKVIAGASENFSSSNKTSFTDIRYGFFGDITVGAARIGPSLGFRYIHDLKEDNPQLHFYAIWKI